MLRANGWSAVGSVFLLLVAGCGTTPKVPMQSIEIGKMKMYCIEVKNEKGEKKPFCSEKPFPDKDRELMAAGDCIMHDLEGGKAKLKCYFPLPNPHDEQNRRLGRLAMRHWDIPRASTNNWQFRQRQLQKFRQQNPAQFNQYMQRFNK